MAQYALVAPDDTIHIIRDESRIDLNAGVRDGYRWLPVVRTTVDTSTGDDTVTSRADPVVEASQVSVVTTTRDMTAQEVSDRDTAAIDEAEQKTFVSDKDTLAIMLTMRDALKAVRDGQLNGLSDAQITNQLRNRFVANRTAVQ